MRATTTAVATTAAASANDELASRPRISTETGEPATLTEMFEQAAQRYHKPDALNYKHDGAWRSISSGELVARARHIALGLYALGVRAGDRVALLSENRPEWTLADAGCLFAGAVDVPVYTTQTPAQVAYILQDSGARLMFVSNKAALARIQSALTECCALEHVIFFEANEAFDTASDAKTLSLAELELRGRTLAAQQPQLASELARVVKPDDLATIIYTSGTTGEPKGVMLTHANLVSNLIDSSHQLDFGPQDTVLSVLPLSHVFERTGMYMYIYRGMTVYYAESLEKLADNLREVRPTVMLSVPRLFEKIYARAQEKAAAGHLTAQLFKWSIETGKLYARCIANKQELSARLKLRYKVASRLVFSKWRAALGGRLRLFVSGGAALPEELGYIFAAAGIPILECYGLTETSPGITVNALTTHRIGTVGRPIPNVEVRIARDGEIETRGPHIMRGYYNKPEATREAFTADGWFKTGDIGALDADGYLRITDRKKELFKTSGGKYIAPQTIEQLLKQSAYVNQIVLVGNNRRFPAALIVPAWEPLRAYARAANIKARSDAELCRDASINALFQHQIDELSESLAQYERVKRFALLEREFTIDGGELTPTLKVKRRVIDEKYADIIDGLYAETAATQITTHS